MNSREIVKRTITFQHPCRMPFRFLEEMGYINDFGGAGIVASPEARLSTGVDEWGNVWKNIGKSNIGQVVKPALESWDDLCRLKIPDIADPKHWVCLDEAKNYAHSRNLFFVGNGISIYTTLQQLRGEAELWEDIYLHPAELKRMLDVLVEMNLYALNKFRSINIDAFFMCDDWGLQDRLQIAPDTWREIWKPAYEKIFKACHENGILTMMHSCGYIIDILDDLIEIGLDCINLDQQELMGLETLGRRFGGRLCFYCPVDIQTVMAYGSLDDIRAYARQMVKCLSRFPAGGFIPKVYADPKGLEQSEDKIKAMCDEFYQINREIFGDIV